MKAMTVLAACAAGFLMLGAGSQPAAPKKEPAATASIEISAVANAGGCYPARVARSLGAMGEDNHRQRLLIKSLMLVGARLDLMYQRQAGHDPLERIRATIFDSDAKER